MNKGTYRNLAPKIIEINSIFNALTDDFHAVVNADNVDVKDLVASSKKMINLIYYITENSTYKQKRVQDYNANVERIKESMNRYGEDGGTYYKLKSSDELSYQEFKLGKKVPLEEKVEFMIKNSTNTDVYTKNMKRLLGHTNKKVSPEYLGAFASMEYDLMTHHLEDNLEGMRKTMNFHNHRNNTMQIGEFTDKLRRVKLLKDDNKKDIEFDPIKVNTFLNPANSIEVIEKKYSKMDLNDPNVQKEKEKVILTVQKKLEDARPEYEKFLATIDNSPFKDNYYERTEKGKEIDKNFLRQLNLSLATQKNIDKCYSLKKDCMVAGMRYQDKIIEQCKKENVDPYESGRLSYMYRLVKDNKPLKNGKESYRVVCCRYDTFKSVMEFNKNLVWSNSYKENLANEIGSKHIEDVERALDDVKKNEGRPYMDNYLTEIAKDEAEMIANHLDKKDLSSTLVDLNIGHVKVSRNEFFNELSFRNMELPAPDHLTKADKEYNEFHMVDVIDECEEIRAKYNGDIEKFENDTYLQRRIPELLDKKERG